MTNVDFILRFDYPHPEYISIIKEQECSTYANTFCSIHPSPLFDEYQRWQRELENQPVEFLGRRFTGLMAESRAALGKNGSLIIAVIPARYGYKIRGKNGQRNVKSRHNDTARNTRCASKSNNAE